MNNLGHPHRQLTHQPYLNQVTVHKHHMPQHTVPVQSAYLAASPVSKADLSSSSSANIYHFNQPNSQQVNNSDFYDTFCFIISL